MTSEPGTLSEETTKVANNVTTNGTTVSVLHEEDELVEKEVRDRFKKMCEGYFDNVCKKLVIEHNVSPGACASDVVRFTTISCTAAARAGQKEPRSVHQVWRDL